jgi:hypothetical protein
MDMILVDKFQIGDEAIEVWQYGRNDFEFQYKTTGLAFRGSLLDVMHDLHLCFKVFGD